jgi:(1->4)-alpha-D-glucan 1-alpha-D-glucosylmutase
VQLNRDFGFYDLKAVLPYLAKLGISHVYASPIFKSRTGSMHGYDMVDPTAISEELGGKAAFEDLNREVLAYKLNWLQDIVPNHAAYSLENKRVLDVMKQGPDSRHAKFFDVDWNYPSPKLNGRVLAPFLGKELAQCIKQKEIELVFCDGGFKIRYYNYEFPVDGRSTQELLKQRDIGKTVERYNSNSELLAGLLSEQFYVLTFWLDAFGEINYRRFFDILDLIGLRMEEQEVFEETHRLILDLLQSNEVSGLRVDHIDGLFYPEEYLQKLRKQAPDTYLLVEKILSGNENLTESWPVQGSTGYDFINYVNGLLVNQTSEAAIDSLYKGFTGNHQTFSEQVFECKKAVIENYFMGDINNLSRLINQTLQRLTVSQFDPDKMPNTVAVLIACFPVYRTYLNPKNPTDKKGHFHLALEQAKQHKPEYTRELDAIDFILKQCISNKPALETMMRLQQFTGSIMAKGLEDTAFYRYCRFLSLNEVGGDPAKFGVSTSEFNQFNLTRQACWPLTLNATSTHDTKRGEDARARLNVLSEIPQELEKHLFCWAEINAKHKTVVNGERAPDHNEEYLIYQTLIGAYPFEPTKTQEFTQRVTTYTVKALKEAKVHTSWITPNKQYETATELFTNQILTDNSFLSDFLPFQKQVAYYGFINSLAQTLLKITCPGIPDFYQGSELWNLSMVDPDNRRPVDYQKRSDFLDEGSAVSQIKTLLENYTSGKAKLYVIFKALQVRRRLKSLFEEGAYVPLIAEGALKEHVFAFMRKKEGDVCVVVVPRFMANLLTPFSWRLDWKDTTIKMPTDAPSTWIEEFTGSRIHASGRFSIKEVLAGFPVALLVGGVTV